MRPPPPGSTTDYDLSEGGETQQATKEYQSKRRNEGQTLTFDRNNTRQHIDGRISTLEQCTVRWTHNNDENSDVK